MSSKLRRRISDAGGSKERYFMRLEQQISVQEPLQLGRQLDGGEVFGFVDLLQFVKRPQQQSCPHPAESVIEKEGQHVCTECGECTGAVYDRSMYLYSHPNGTVGRKHYYRPEAYLKSLLKKVGKSLPQWAMLRLGRVWPFVVKVFRRVVAEQAQQRKRKNMICYSFVIQALLRRWDVDTEGMDLKPLKTVGRRREVNRIWSLMTARFPDTL